MNDGVRLGEPSGVSKSQGTALRQLRGRSSPKQVFHLAEGENLTSILKQGSKSTAKPLARRGLPDQERIALLRGYRPTHLRHQGILIREQAPMPPAAPAPALNDGMEPRDWYALVNDTFSFSRIG